MGRLEDIGKAASGFVDTTARAVGNVVETVGDIVADLLETAGNGAQDGLNAAGEAVREDGGPLRATVAWAGGMIAGTTKLVSAVIKGVFGIVGGVVSGLIRLVGGFLVLDFRLVLKGEIDIGSSIAGAVILVAGAGLSLGQRAFGAQKERSLTKAERTLLNRIFLNSVSLYNIRIIEGESGLFGVNDTPFTLGNTIYMKHKDPRVYPHILIHECVHVWQYQNLGARYTMDALGAQAIYGRLKAYVWEDELRRGNSAWRDFNKEAQAELIEEVWLYGTSTLRRSSNIGTGSFFTQQSGSDIPTVSFIFNKTDHTELAIAAVESLRGKMNFRISKAF
jgi:hypothetical protein